MTSSHRSIFFFVLLLIAANYDSASAGDSLELKIKNHCSFKIWPAIQPNNGYKTFEDGGFELDQGDDHSSINFPNNPWSGRVWARTGCTGEGKKMKCATGDCGSGLHCHPPRGGMPPFTFAEISVHNNDGHDSAGYRVTVYEGCNVPMTVTASKSDLADGKCKTAECSACAGSRVGNSTATTDDPCDPSTNAGMCKHPAKLTISFCSKDDDQFISST